MSVKQLLKWNNESLDLTTPAIMGILNITPDSFFDGGKFTDTQSAIDHALKMAEQGAAIIDVGAVSTRPFSNAITAEEEWARLTAILPKLRKVLPETLISVDTYRASVAAKAAGYGADIINDISGGQMDKEMFNVITDHQIPYIMMHMKGTPQNMQINPEYYDVVEEVFEFFLQNLEKLDKLGNKSPIVIDPGFGFGKTTEHNYQLLHALQKFKSLGVPLLTGISRKSMINRVLNVKPDQALTGTIVLNTIALLNGANILRVHDVDEARQAIEIVEAYKNFNLNPNMDKPETTKYNKQISNKTQCTKDQKSKQ
jgi:dihydropteroate synthase